MAGGHRLLFDKGLRVTLAGMAGVVAVLALDHWRDTSRRAEVRTGAALRVQVFCGGRGVQGARVQLRHGAEKPAHDVGRPLAEVETARGGVANVPLPVPLPPGWQADLVVGSEGCIGQRKRVGEVPTEHAFHLVSAEVAEMPRLLLDGADAPGFPPAAPVEQLERLRSMGVYARDGFQLFDGQAPSCAQCHASSAAEHATTHGAATGPLFTTELQALPSARRASCLPCHAPALATAATPVAEVTPAAFPCRACHQVRAERADRGRGVGLHSHIVGAGADTRPFALGTRLDTSSPVMAIQAESSLSDTTLCAACHAWSAEGPPAWLVDPTVEEHEATAHARPDGALTCRDCHFPATNDPFLVDGAARIMWGVAHSDRLRRSHAGTRGPALRVTVVSEGGARRVELANVGASHAVPGAGHRTAWRLVVGGGDGGAAEELGRLQRRYDGEGPCVAPWNARGVMEDSRLKPGEARVFKTRASGDIRIERIDPCDGRVLAVVFSDSLARESADGGEKTREDGGRP